MYHYIDDKDFLRELNTYGGISPMNSGRPSTKGI